MSPIVREVTFTDPRVERSTRQLGVALVELLHERTFDTITVSDILERAGVGRSTFYAHYRNKQDVLHSTYERMFSAFEHQLDRSHGVQDRGFPAGRRLIPVCEFSAHVGDASALVHALRKSRRMEELWDLAIGYLARMIERRIVPLNGESQLVPAALVSRMLAGAYLEMLKWWLDHPGSSTPAALDATFHDVARATLARVKYDVAVTRE